MTPQHKPSAGIPPTRRRGRAARSALSTALMAGLALGVLAGCSLPEVSTGTGEVRAVATDPGDLTFAVISHAQPGDSFWDVVQSGAREAGEELGIGAVEYAGAPNGGDQAVLVDNAVAKGVDGILVSLANPAAMRASVRAAVAAGIPVVTMNSGIDTWQEMGALTHIGQSETIAGQRVGTELSERGLTNAICVVHETGNISQEERCSAVRETFTGKVTDLVVDGTDVGAVGTTINSKLQSDPSVDAVVTLSSQYAPTALQAAKDAGSAAKIATFDVDRTTLERVQAGDILFAVDQQPYLQGYLGVVALHLKATQGLSMGGGQPVYSGPAVIDSAAAGAALSAMGSDR